MLVLGSLFFVAALWVATAFLIQRHGAVAPLHYTIYFGIDLTAAADQLYLIPGVATLVWIAHITAAGAVKHVAWRQAWLVLGTVICILLGAILASLNLLDILA